MNEPRFAYIYGLKDPTDGQIHYVGKSNNPDLRLQEHLADKKTNGARVGWLHGLHAAGLQPELVILAKTLYQEWRETEIYWIARGHEDGWPLTNIHPGGAGGKGEYRAPIHDFMRAFVGDDLWAQLDGLALRQKDAICLQTAQRAIAEAGFYAPRVAIAAVARDLVMQSRVASE
jgi:hypothetical protein